jgi:TetR/AcrR family transcriptional regulator, regulator of cefoperazone and chloramphenicol sensitivity
MAPPAPAPGTRQRILEVAARLFAAHGFKNVTVRDICTEAQANIAAVNYYFRDKQGLYEQVFQYIVAETLQRTEAELQAQAEVAKDPEEKLRFYIRLFLTGLLTSDGGLGNLLERLIAREAMDPVISLEGLVTQGILPKFFYLCQVVSQVMGCAVEEPQVLWAAHNIQGMCLMYRQAQQFYRMPAARGFLSRWRDDFTVTPELINEIAESVFRFSLAGIRALAQPRTEVRP